MNHKIEKILAEVKKVIVGKDEVVEKILMAILAGGHILLEDVPGVGKTTLALAFARVMQMDQTRISFTVDTMPSDITGFHVYDKQSGSFRYHPGPVMSNLLLADEINRTSCRTQAALLEVMEEKKVTVDGETYVLPEPFCVLATQNPIGSAGTQLLPNSQLDRFMIKLHMGYPDFESHVNMLKERHTGNPLEEITPVITTGELLELQQECMESYISDSIYGYVTRLAEATRSHEEIELGLSPRGALALCRMAKGFAYVNSRSYVVPEDIKRVFVDVCGHRIKLDAKAKLSRITPEDCLKNILRDTPLPEIEEEP